MSRSKSELKALEDAFDVCWIMGDQLGNVIASGEYSKEDIDLKKQCTSFINWYKKEILLKSQS